MQDEGTTDLEGDMARTCAACGRANDDDASFCKQCGAPLAAAPPPPPPPGPSGAPSAATFPAPSPPGPPPASSSTPVTPPGPPPAPPGNARPPRRGKPAPRWLVTLVAVAVVALVAVMAFAFFPRGGKDDDVVESPSPTAGATVATSPSPALDQYLAGAVGPKADRLAAIMSDGTVKPITRFSGQQIWQIAYSPDGKWLACIAGTWKRRELWLFDTASGAARQVTAAATEVVAVDSIAWLSTHDLLLAGFTEAPKSTGENADFLVYDTVTEDIAPLTGNGGVALRGVSVSASQEGAKVAFVTYTDRKTDQYGMVTATERLEVLDRPTGEIAELGHDKAYFDVNARAFDEPLISPNGEAVIYRRAGSDVGTSYTVVGVDGTVLMPEKQATMPAGYAWDPGGTKVVFTGQPITSASGTMPVTFWQFDTKTGGAPTVLAKYEDAAVQSLSWSPDGSTIAWAEYDKKMDWRTGIVYLMPATGGDSSTLVKQALLPVWAPGAAEPLQTSPSP
jgi:Tol biopolymer transport system component